MKIPSLLFAAALAVLPLATQAQPAPTHAPSLAITPRTVQPFSLIDAFFKVCVLASTPDASRAAVQVLGGTAEPMPPGSPGAERHPENFTLKLDGIGAHATFDESGLCMVGVNAAEVAPVLAMFDDAVGSLGARVVTMTDRTPPPGATLHRDVTLVFAPEDRFMTRLQVLSMEHANHPAEMFLMHVIQAHEPEAAQQRAEPPLTPTPVPPGADYAASEDVAGRMNHPPQFPEEALHACESGTVRLLVTVDQQGMVQNVALEQTSGHRDLDRAAMDAARTWYFRPGMSNGLPIGGDVLVPVRFNDPCATP